MPNFETPVCEKSLVRVRSFTAMIRQTILIMRLLSDAGYKISKLQFTVKESWFLNDMYQCEIHATKWVPEAEVKE